MQSGNAVVPEKVQTGGSGDGELGGKSWWPHYQNPGQQNFPVMDERDGFLAWLRGEFAAANVMIDALCHHLSVLGEAGEYEEVIGCIQQRRSNWTPVLYMQHFYPVTEVLHALQRVPWRRQQRGGFEGHGRSGREYHRRGGGRLGQRFDGFRERKDTNSHNGSWNVDAAVMKDKTLGDKKDCVLKPEAESLAGNTSSTETLLTRKSEDEPADINDKNMCLSEGLQDEVNHTHSEAMPHEKQSVSVPKTFVGNEILDGKTLNVVEGMKLYERLFADSKVSRLTTLVNDLRAAGRRGQLNAPTFVVSKKPMKGHGRERIQFGLRIADSLHEDEAADCHVEPIPSLFQDIIENLLAMEIVSVKPDSCIIDIFNEGDHSQPHMWPHCFGRPVCVFFLTDCDLTFGKVITAEYPGDYRGSLKLSLKPGSVLTLQGRAADFAKHAIPSLRKQRILVTFVKAEPKRNTYADAALASSHWVPPPSRSPNHFRPTMAPRLYGPVTATGVLPPAARAPLPPTNGIQTILVPAPVAVPSAATGWPAVAPRHAPPRLPVPGTGVFLPASGSGGSLNHSIPSTVPAGDTTGIGLAHSVLDKTKNGKNGVEMNSNTECSITEVHMKGKPLEHSGDKNETGEVKSFAEEGNHLTSDSEAAERTDGTESR